MPELTIQFPESFTVFNRHLKQNDRCVVYPLLRRSSVKDIIESCGVPHTEIGAIKVNGQAVDYGFIPQDSGRVVVHPICSPFDVTQPSMLRPRPLKTLRFIADVNVGKLAALLRMAGLDTAYHNAFTDKDVARISKTEGRVVLSKDTGLLKRKQVAYGRYVRGVYPDDQLREVIDFFGIRGPLRLFSRCIRCNAELVAVEKKDVLHRLEPKTKRYFHRFKLCRACNRVYWQGSHHEHMAHRLRSAGIRT